MISLVTDLFPQVVQLLNMSLYRYQRVKPVIIDPGLYSLQKSVVFWITEKRSVPIAFKLFTCKYTIIFPENYEMSSLSHSCYQCSLFLVFLYVPFFIVFYILIVCSVGCHLHVCLSWNHVQLIKQLFFVNVWYKKTNTSFFFAFLCWPVC